MTAVAQRVRGSVDRSGRTLALLVGDVVAITLFVLLGELSHGIDPLANLTYIVTNTLGPFLVGWVVVGVPAGVYSDTRGETLRRVAVRTAGAWLGADVVAQAIRATPFIVGGGSVWAILVFGAVSYLVGGLILVTWRVGTALLSDRWRTTGPV